MTAVEFADYQCPYCKSATKIVDRLIARFDDQVRVVYRDFPLNRSGISREISEGAVCAEQQGRFWAYQDLAFERQDTLKMDSAAELAAELSLDISEFKACLQFPRTEAKVAKSKAEAITPDVAIPTLLLVLIYGAGIASRAAVVKPPSGSRHVAFFAGVALVFLALQSSIDPIAERLFFVHQIQHLLLRTVGPMLIALAWPQGLLVAGIPAPVRRSVLAPVVASRAVRTVFGALSHPVIATVLFIAALYFWQIPRYHDLALLNDPIHYTMHGTMLFAGLAFWWRVFERSAAPEGPRYGARLIMLWLVIVSNIALGAYTTLKSTVLYEAYDVFGRLFDYPPLLDEQLGGIVIWMPSSMMCVVAVLIVIRLWGRSEARRDKQEAQRAPSNSAALRRPTAESVPAEARAARNRTLALGLAAFVLAVFATTLLIGALSSLSGAGETEIEASGSEPVGHASHEEVPSKPR